jgi:hypothetical protein
LRIINDFMNAKKTNAGKDSNLLAETMRINGKQARGEKLTPAERKELQHQFKSPRS